MARFLNPNGAPFKESLRTRIYEDKSAMIEFINQQICTRDKYICVSRPRRFGKSMALDMLAAYYCLGRDYKELFKDFASDEYGDSCAESIFHVQKKCDGCCHECENEGGEQYPYPHTFFSALLD